MRIEQIETTVLEMPYKKPLVTATNNFTVARGLLVKVVTNAEWKDDLGFQFRVSGFGFDVAARILPSTCRCDKESR